LLSRSDAIAQLLPVLLTGQSSVLCPLSSLTLLRARIVFAIACTSTLRGGFGCSQHCVFEATTRSAHCARVASLSRPDAYHSTQYAQPHIVGFVGSASSCSTVCLAPSVQHIFFAYFRALRAFVLLIVCASHFITRCWEWCSRLMDGVASVTLRRQREWPHNVCRYTTLLEHKARHETQRNLWRTQSTTIVLRKNPPVLNINQVIAYHINCSVSQDHVVVGRVRCKH
jgi:hypothetical protein